WTFRLEGSFATLSGLGADLTADALVISLLDPLEPSIMNQSLAKRTLLALERGKQQWPLEPLHDDKHWHFSSYGSSFDAIQVEAGESRSGHKRQALIAESHGDESRLAVRPSEALIGGGGETFALPLRNVRYAMAFDPAGDRTANVPERK